MNRNMKIIFFCLFCLSLPSFAFCFVDPVTTSTPYGSPLHFDMLSLTDETGNKIIVRPADLSAVKIDRENNKIHILVNCFLTLANERPRLHLQGKKTSPLHIIFLSKDCSEIGRIQIHQNLAGSFQNYRDSFWMTPDEYLNLEKFKVILTN